MGNPSRVNTRQIHGLGFSLSRQLSTLEIFSLQEVRKGFSISNFSLPKDKMECLNRILIPEKCHGENRKFLRFSVSLRAECHYNAGEIAEQCRIVDICEQGLGFELDTSIGMRYGQNVLLKIAVSPGKIPVSAIVKLKWVKIPCEGFMTQRVGSQLLFIDARDKVRLLQHAYAEALSDVSRKDSTNQAFRAYM